MRSDDKLNYAWRLTIISNLSKIKVVDACAVANGTVGKMRKVKAALLADGQHTEEDFTGLTMERRACRGGRQEKDVNYNPEEAIKRRAERYRVALFRALGDRPYNDPEAFGLALLHLDSRFPKGLCVQSRGVGRSDKRCETWQKMIVRPLSLTPDGMQQKTKTTDELSIMAM